MNRWLAGWRLSLRLARRDALRSRGRSLLVLAMIALPVLAVSAADVVLQTQDVSSVESLDRRLGSATASVSLQKGVAHVVQAPDPDDGSNAVGDDAGAAPVAADEISRLLGGARLVEIRTGDANVVTAKGEAYTQGTEVDLHDAATRGLFRLTSGRLPQATDEVVVNQALADKGYAVGDVLDLAREGAVDPTIVGLAESATLRDSPAAAGPVGSLHVRTYGTRSWLVDGGPVSWATVLQLNQVGATVLSREVVTNPPPIPPEVQQYLAQSSGDVIAVIVLIVVMALIEVVLLAGPAFAVGARRQARSLALMASAGGTPPQTRRVVLAGAVVLGGLASVIGVVAGIGVGRALVPVLQRYDGSWFGPFDVPWPHLLGVAGFGLLSALLAAVVPATIASRQDVAAVLAGRRGDRKPSLRSPVLGVVLLGLGIAGAVVGSRSGDVNGAYFIAGAAIASVLGMVLLVPVVLVLVARLSSALPLTLRYAARDAARHRTRTVPAVAAVAATVAGVVALGIALGSDEAQNEAEYTPSFADGLGVVTGPGDYATYTRLVQREVPDATVAPVLGLPYPGSGFRDVSITTTGSSREGLLMGYGSSFGSDVLVSDGTLPTGLVGLGAEARQAAAAALRDGRSVVFTDTGVTADEVRITVTTFRDNGKRDGPTVRGRLPVVTVPVGGDGAGVGAGPQAVLSAHDAAALDLPVATVALTVSGTTVTQAQEDAVTESLAGVSDAPLFTVERGYESDSETVIVQLVLAGLGAVLMLGGTLTATFLALSDARPDLATLSAIGASPRRRRGIAAAYAVVVGVVGALLGVVVGFIPGIAITYPLTSTGGDTCTVTGGSGHCEASGASSGPFLDVPWLLILGLVVVLPLLTALVVGAAVRSRLPLVARLD